MGADGVRRSVQRAIVHDDDLVDFSRLRERVENAVDASRLVVRGNDGANATGSGALPRRRFVSSVDRGQKRFLGQWAAQQVVGS